MSSHILPKGTRKSLSEGFRAVAKLIEEHPKLAKKYPIVASVYHSIADGLAVPRKPQIPQ